MKRFSIILFIYICALHNHNLFSQSVTPVDKTGNCQFNFNNVFFEASSKFGGRISSHKINGSEILTTGTTPVEMCGSVLWPSPQNEWGWPPIPAIDNEPYKFEIQGNRCRMTGNIASGIKMRVIKDFYAATEDTSVTIVYKLVNESTSVKKNAAWEVTRVPPPGLFFFPTGEESATSGVTNSVEEIDGYTWYTITSQSSGSKFFADGSKGWCAFADKNGYVFIKQFIDVPNKAHAPGENEIELYLGGNYIELENQSAYTTIAAGEMLTYVVKWYLRKLPVTIKVKAGNHELVDFVTNTIGSAVFDPETGTDVPSNVNLAELSVSPNPASDYIIISDELNRKLNVEVFSISGELLITETLQSCSALNIKKLNKGVYIMKIMTDNKITAKHFIVK